MDPARQTRRRRVEGALVTGPEPRKTTVVPAILGLSAIAILAALLMLRRGHDAPPSRAVPPAAAPTAGAPPEPPPAPIGTTRPPPTAAERPDGVPMMSRAEPPEPKAKKPPLTLDEKLELTEKHIAVMQTRAELLDREIRTAEAAGKKDEAEQKRIMLTRLKAHMEKLRAAVAEHREPQ
jgi:hypothetical protein